mmetsp:Transcript_35422/g.110760  ORF Transcript_35422/g.110760 Transcript_35422/m.110760 type:complete len:224 (+) Transcript_35422:3299-3970(+)
MLRRLQRHGHRLLYPPVASLQQRKEKRRCLHLHHAAAVRHETESCSSAADGVELALDPGKGGQLLHPLPSRVHRELVLDERVPATGTRLCRPVGVAGVVDVDGCAEDAQEIDQGLLLRARGLENRDHVDKEGGEGRVLAHGELPLDQLLLLVQRSWCVSAKEEGKLAAHLSRLELLGHCHPHGAETMVEAAGEAAEVGEDTLPLTKELNLGEKELQLPVGDHN